MAAAPRNGVWTASAERSLRSLEFALFGALPVVWIVGVLVLVISSDTSGFDLRGAFLPAAHHVLHGDSPYPAIGDPALARQTAYVYPPFVAFALVPLTLVPAKVALAFWVVALALLAPAAIAMAGCRDWRCYGLTLYSAPVYNAIHDATISIVLAFLIGLAWRTRRSAQLSGALLGIAAAIKLFLIPVLAWTIATKRIRAFLAAVIVGSGVVVATWAAIGFAGFTSYPSLLRKLTAYEEKDSYSISGALRALGFGTTSSRAVAFVIGLGLLAACVAVAQRAQERRAFALSVLASLALTPILWQHYLVVLLVCLAVTKPTLSPAWFLPLLLWVAPFTGNGALWQTLAVPIVVVLIGAACVRGDSRRYPEVGRNYASSSPPP